MSDKPQTPPHMIRGKYISAVTGFADAWDWLIDSAFNFEVGDGLDLQWSDDHPRLTLTAAKERGAFALDGATVTNCHFQLGRNGPVVTLPDKTLSDGTWYLVIYHTEPSQSQISETPQTGNDYTSIPLFTISGGEVTDDYRGMPIVPMWDAEEGA